MPIINGKFIVEPPPDFDRLQRQIETLNQQFQRLEWQMTVISAKEKKEHLQKLNSVQQSLQKLERIYNRLLSTTIAGAIALGGWYVWQGLNPQIEPGKLQSNQSAIAAIKPTTNH